MSFVTLFCMPRFSESKRIVLRRLWAEYLPECRTHPRVQSSDPLVGGGAVNLWQTVAILIGRGL